MAKDEDEHEDAALSAWLQFERSIPDKLATARWCKCGERVPESEACWMAEEYFQMRDTFIDIYMKALLSRPC
jgi:hypothetical protein